MAFNANTVEEDLDSDYIETKNTFDKDHMHEYKTNLSSPETIQKLDDLISKLENIDTHQDIDTCVGCFSDTLDSVCKPLFVKKLSCNTDTKGNDSRTKLLYNEDCENKKQKILNRLNNLGSVRMIQKN